jgi:vancomycin resistance protein YoaR
VEIVQAEEGRRVETEKLRLKIIRQLLSVDDKAVEVPVVVLKPKVLAGDTALAIKEVEKILKVKLRLVWDRGTRQVVMEDISRWIEFNSVKDENGYRMKADLSEDKVKVFLKDLGKDVNKAPKNAKLTINEGSLGVLEGSEIGYAMNEEAAAKDIIVAMNKGGEQVVTLQVSEVQPEVNSNNLEELGIKEIIGSAATSFRGSTESRRHNVANGARIINNVLIKPGEEFSIVKALGPVDGLTGYVLGLVIKGNKTESEYGGGLCQVSTTLFRTALNTGLKVTERTNHRYRVHYYESDGDGKYIGPGLDSTIYAPHPDLRFVNDTGKWILIQTRVEMDKNKLIFELWGTKDGRVVKMDGPHISDEVNSPAPEYIETDTLPLGTKKQIEWAAKGAKAVVNYSVEKDGKEIIKQTFTSRFKPWGAKYLVGTKMPETPPQ